MCNKISWSDPPGDKGGNKLARTLWQRDVRNLIINLQSSFIHAPLLWDKFATLFLFTKTRNYRNKTMNTFIKLNKTLKAK